MKLVALCLLIIYLLHRLDRKVSQQLQAEHLERQEYKFRMLDMARLRTLAELQHAALLKAGGGVDELKVRYMKRQELLIYLDTPPKTPEPRTPFQEAMKEWMP